MGRDMGERIWDGSWMEEAGYGTSHGGGNGCHGTSHGGGNGCHGTSLRILNFINACCCYFTSVVQQHYCYNVTGQSRESEGSYKPPRIKEVHSELHSFLASLCTFTATHLTLIYVCTYIRLSVPLGCLIKQAGIIIQTILNMWGTPGIEPVTSGLTSVYQISSSTT